MITVGAFQQNGINVLFVKIKSMVSHEALNGDQISINYHYYFLETEIISIIQIFDEFELMKNRTLKSNP